MSIQHYDTLPELIANLGPVELRLYDEFGEEDYLNLMDMWASVAEDNFEEWYNNTDIELAEYIIELSDRASKIIKMVKVEHLIH